jgi:uncharacterized protein (DUF2237 family)
MTSLTKKPLKICSTDPMTGYNRDGYCSNLPDDSGTHVVCAKMTNEFLEFTKSKGNDLSTPRSNFPGLKEGDKWCVCALRWDEAAKENKAPPVDLEASDESALKFNNLKTYTQTRKSVSGGKRKTKKQKFNVYINANPADTIPIKYTTLEDVKNTIVKLEKLYKAKLYPHKRIWQVAMIMKVRLEVLKKTKPMQYKLASKYLKFLSNRSKYNETARYTLKFTLNQ